MTDRAIIYRLAAESLFDARTVGRVVRGERVRPATRRAVETAARKLRIALPSDPSKHNNDTTPPEAA